MKHTNLEREVIGEFKFLWRLMNEYIKDNNQSGAWHVFIKLTVVIDFIGCIYPKLDTFKLWKCAFDKTR